MRTVSELIGTFSGKENACADLEPVLRGELEKWRSAGAIKRYSLEMEAGIENAAVRGQLKLIACEAVANAARHAHASIVSVRLRSVGNEAELSVYDDGIGIHFSGHGMKTTQVTTHPFQGEGNGIRFMRERVRENRGRMTFGTPEAGGTELIVTIPLSSDFRKEEKET